MKANRTHRKAGIAGALLGTLLPLSGLAAPAASAADPAPATIHHDVYVAMVTNHGDFVDSDAAMLTQIGDALTRWEEASDGRLSITLHPVIKFHDDSDCQDRMVLRKEARALPELAGIDTRPSATTGQHVIVLSPPNCNGGDGDGGQHGLQSSGSITLHTGVELLYQETFHEFGHNVGLDHANAMHCDPDCARVEYANWYSTMGTTFWRPAKWSRFEVPALDSYQRDRLGLSGDDVTSFALEPGRRTRTLSFDLHPRSAEAGTRGVKVVEPVTGTTYYFDFRNGSGSDGGSPYTIIWDATSQYWFNKGVTVDKVETTGSNGYQNATLQTFPQLDGSGSRFAKTADPADTPYEVGGLKMAVDSMDLTGSVDDVARITVTLTDPSVPLSVQDAGELTITGHNCEGAVLTATPSGWAADETLGEIHWYDNGVAIEDATGSTYTIPAGKHGHRITARITGSRESYQDRTAISDEVVVDQGLPGVLEIGATYELRALGGELASSNGVMTPSNNLQMVVEKAPSTGSSSQQRWTVLAGSDGTYRFKNVGSGKCLDDEWGKTTAKNQVIQWYCGFGTNQYWSLTGNGTGWVLTNQASGKALTVDGTDKLVQDDGSYGWGLTKVS